MKVERPPTISVIIPLYNVEEYIERSLGSIIGQTIGLENMEIILVDDGSTDDTEKISKTYTARYPHNIRYLKQKNKGVSAARNKGLATARGLYINFFDADDVWQKDALEKAVRFLESHRDVDLVAAKIKFFDKSIDEHPLNYKFNDTQVLDLNHQPDNPILHIISCIIRKESLTGKQFDERLKITEDAKLLSEVLLDKKKYGVLSGTHYNYRKRQNATSAIDGSALKKYYYLETPKLAYEAMADEWTVDEKMHPFMQYTLLYDLSYRIAGAPYMFLTPAEESGYANIIHSLVKRFDVSVIESCRWYTHKQKEYLLDIRRHKSLTEFRFIERNITKPKRKHPILGILFNWRFRQAAAQFRKLRGYNLRFLSTKAKVFETSKPLLISVEALIDIPRAVMLRVGYHILRAAKKKEVWIISDRVMAAGDNGEALFRYIQAQDLDIDAYFVLSKKSKDYARLKKYGKVLNQDSWHYLVKFLLADKVISSHANIETTNPFIRNKDHYEDLMSFDFIFLQHGVIANDLSGWLNKSNSEIRLFITSSAIERDSIVNNPAYGFSKEEVVLTGLPRWDSLENRPKHKLIIAPTYRASLLSAKTHKNGTRDYDPSFKNSVYYNFYNDLINDQRILKTLHDHGMTCEVYIHPNFSQQVKDFTTTSSVKIATFPYDYTSAISEGSLLVSDYSSVCFDFAYLYKPVIYTQFDREDFYKGHPFGRGYFFSYEENGLGPVTRTYEQTVSEIIRAIDNECAIGRQYKKRISEFFYKTDKDNCKRVLDAIMKLQNE